MFLLLFSQYLIINMKQYESQELEMLKDFFIFSFKQKFSSSIWQWISRFTLEGGRILSMILVFIFPFHFLCTIHTEFFIKSLLNFHWLLFRNYECPPGSYSSQDQISKSFGRGLVVCGTPEIATIVLKD